MAEENSSPLPSHICVIVIWLMFTLSICAMEGVTDAKVEHQYNINVAQINHYGPTHQIKIIVGNAITHITTR